MSYSVGSCSLTELDAVLKAVLENPGAFSYNMFKTDRAVQSALQLGLVYVGADFKLWPCGPRRSAIIEPAVVAQPSKAESDGDTEWVV